jgi:hypothetical protein
MKQYRSKLRNELNEKAKQNNYVIVDHIIQFLIKQDISKVNTIKSMNKIS